jgi:hypothetical protein
MFIFLRISQKTVTNYVPILAFRFAESPPAALADVLLLPLVNLFDLGRQNKIAFSQAVDLVSPDFHLDLAP